MVQSRKTPRKHGLQGPFSSSQIATWVLFPALAGSFYLTTVAFLEDDELLVYVATYSAIFLVFLGCWLLCTFLDPAKPAFVACLTMKQEQRNTKMFCQFCQKQTLGFDHHCAWLNTCVGGRQYPFFMLLCLYGVLMTALQVALCVSLLANTSEALEQKIDEKLGSDVAFYILLSLESAVGGITFLAFLALTTFHLYLNVKGYGTYLHLLNKRVRQRSRHYERASKMSLGRPSFMERLLMVCSCCSKDKEDKASSMMIDISRVESTVVKQSMVSGEQEKFEVDLDDKNYNKKKPTANTEAVQSTNYETSVTPEEDL